MKTTDTITQFFPAIRSQLTALQLEIETNPPTWHAALQKAINQGAFIKLEFGFGLAGPVDARLILVSLNGDEATIGGLDHV